MLFLEGCQMGFPEHLFSEGDAEVKGILRRAHLSAVRRGTHVLEKDGSTILYVESPTVRLQPYEDQEVLLMGTVERNVDPKDLSVLVVSHVEGRIEQEKQWNVSAFSLRFHAPSWWVRHEDASRVFFTVSGSFLPIVGIDRSSDPLPASGDFLVVDGIPAIRLFYETHGGQQVFLKRDSETVILTLTQDGAEDPSVRSGFLRMLRTMKFMEQDSVVVQSSGSLLPCGGPRGLLCLEDEYCAFPSLKAETGVCVHHTTTSP